MQDCDLPAGHKRKTGREVLAVYVAYYPCVASIPIC